MKANQLRKATVMLLTLLLICSTTSSRIYAQDYCPEIIAAWEYTTSPSSATVHATGGDHATGAALTNSNHAIPGYSAAGLFIAGWDNGEFTKYWQISLSTIGYEDIVFYAKVSSSEIGPKDFKLIYSIDEGQNWKVVQAGAYTLSPEVFNQNTGAISLPADAEDVNSLQLRLIMTTNFSSRSGGDATMEDDKVQPPGISSINNVIVSGSPLQSVDFQPAAAVAALQEGIDLGGLTEVVLSCMDKDAKIMYSINEDEYKEYDAYEKIILEQSPATVKAYAVKDGQTGNISVYYYN